MSMYRLAQASVLLPLVLLVAGCEQDGQSTDAAQERTGARTPEQAAAALGKPVGTPVVEKLTCYTNQRSIGFFDYFGNATSGSNDRTPKQAVQSWATGDRVVVTGEMASDAVVWVLRSDGTAHTRLDVRSFRDGTWAVQRSEACSGRMAPAGRRN